MSTKLVSEAARELIRGTRHRFRSEGLMAAGVYVYQSLRMVMRARPGHRICFTDHARFPLIRRCGSSDLEVFEQIFVQREYACLDDVGSASLVVDCGANVGYSAAYFLTRFPHARIICVEPDPGNFEIMAKNLAPYRSRSRLVKSAIWSHPVGLSFVEVPFRDGRQWAIQVRECPAEETPSMWAVDIGTLLRESGASRIDVLKMDVEGAEATVFANNTDSWLPQCENIVIELHDDTAAGPCSAFVTDKIRSTRSYRESTFGELSVFRSPTA